MNTGREVAVGRLWRMKAVTARTEKERVRVVLHCGSPDCTRHGQLDIYDEDLVTSKPFRLIPLHLVQSVVSLNTQPSAPPAPRHKSRAFRKSMTDSQLNHQPASLWGFMLLLQTGEGVELYAEAREEQQLWIRLLNLLSTYPYSPIPEEPRVCPIKEKFRARLNPANFDADSVWAVYILPEEVGSRIQALGMQYLVLQSSLSQQATATLKIISPLDMEPIVTWEATKMRRTGNLGSLMFIEVGRRCEGGPGLLWMCTTPADTQSFKETLQRFIYSGDGRPVPSAKSPNQQLDQQLYFHNRMTATSQKSTCSSSFRFSSSPSSTSSSPGDYEDTSEYAYTGFTGMRSVPQMIRRSGSQAQSHTFHSSPFSSTPPPINLSTHPSISKSSKRSSEDLSDSSPMESPSSSDQLFLSGMIAMLEGLDTEDRVSPLVLPNSSRVPHLMRTQSLPGKSAPVKKRANTTSTCQPTRYLKVTHFEEDDQQDDYMFMKPGHRPATWQKASTKEISRSDSNYDFLEPAHLARSSHKELVHSSIYENSPLPPDVAQATPLVFEPSYQNFNPSKFTPEIPEPHQVTQDDPSSVNKETVIIDSASHTNGNTRSDKLQSVMDELDYLGHVLEGFGSQ